MIFVVGARGRLGQMLVKQYPSEEVIAVERAVYENWSSDTSENSITEYFSPYADQGSIVYICSGLLDPRLEADALHRVNFVLPKNIIQSVASMGIRAMTFGTAMEATLTSNPYVQSKLLLGQFVEQAGDMATHVRIHTLYGTGTPSPFMFLGQVLTALQENSEFKMTMGRQLREYHHVSDDACAIKHLAENRISGIIELSHGKPVTLRALAEAVFQAFDKADLLRLGAIPEPKEENFGDIFTPPSSLVGLPFRDTIPSVVKYMKTLVNA